MWDRAVQSEFLAAFRGQARRVTCSVSTTYAQRSGLSPFPSGTILG